MNQVITYYDSPAHTNARVLLSLMLIAAACLFADAIVGLRSVDVGTDTQIYTDAFLRMRHGLVTTRWEPGFVLLTAGLSMAGLSVAAYQGMLFLLLLATVVAATRQYHDYLASESLYLTFLTASLLFLFLSPLFVNASINAVRQGLASLLVFAALLAFYQRQWRGFFLFGLVATSFHYSSMLYLLFAPALLLNIRILRIVGMVAFLAYCSGLTLLVVRALTPALYTFVMSYDASAASQKGVRLDFAVFSMFWYLLPYGVSRLVREPVRERINRSTAIYLVMLLPFFLVGWGNFSNRYLMPAWMAASLIVAAIFCNSRLSLMRNPLLLRMGLIAASGIFYFYVSHGMVL